MIYRILLLICILIPSLNVKSENKVAMSYDAVYNSGKFTGFDAPKTVENVLGKNIDELITAKLKGTDKHELLSTLHQYNLSDTIVSIKMYDVVRGRANEYLNIGAKILFWSYNYKEYINLKILDLEDIYNPSSLSFDTTFMVALNVFANWNMDEITCLLESSTPVSGASYTITAERYILTDKRIESFTQINFIDCLNWNLKKCYGNNYPKHLLHDMRYIDMDSSIIRYMTGPLYDNLYWDNN